MLASGWTSVVLPLLPRELLAGVEVSVLAASTVALRFSPICLVSSAFLSVSATVSSNFFVALVNSSTCVLTSSAVAFSFFNTSLASDRTLSRSFEILLIFSFSVDFTKVSNLIASLLSSSFSTFTAGSAATGTSTLIVLFAFPESPLASLSTFGAAFEVFPTFWLSCDTGIFSALADIPPPKKISDATATLAAPKWYFLIEKRVSFSPSLYSYLIIYICISFIFFYYLIRCCIITSRYLGYSYINNITR